jgi:putative DNA primase/helicase
MTAAALGRAALALARRGLRVHPCVPGAKEPLLKDWPNRATLDPRTIESWWRKWPIANIGVATGGAMRLLVIDVDPEADGESSMANLEREYGSLPATIESVTPRGGRHLYMTVPSGRPLPVNGVSKLAPGIDTRCRGGFAGGPAQRGGRERCQPLDWA